ncbi:TPA: ribbon-helix-helix protein, CopG family [Serratia marcescens]|nr:ribbon-helix-helix protein, CopG family [Serratia marcescens]
MTRLTVDLSKDVDARLTDIATRHGISKAEAMRRAFALLAVADSESTKKNGSSLGIVREDDAGDLKAVGRVVGIF